MIERACAPGAAEVEVSLFGPGRGESCLVHLGGGDWMIVDSCRDQTIGGAPPSALSYLESISVGLAQVKVIVVTHAHDDHFDGIAETFAQCSEAKLWVPTALTREEFFAHLEAASDLPAQLRGTALDEYRQIYAIARQRVLAGGRTAISPMKYAQESRTVFERGGSEGVPAARVDALSPSDLATTRATRKLAESAPVRGADLRFTVIDPNECAIALGVEVGDVAVLLGADLPVGPVGCGWRAVLETIRRPFQASLFKIPHHGSVTGHHDRIWDELLTGEPLALIAPFRGGNVLLPKPGDVERIQGRTSQAYLTARAEPPATKKAVREARGTLMSIAEQVWEKDGMVGRVTARRRVGEARWRVITQPPAYAIGRERSVR